MDVVKTNIEKIGGTVDVQASAGQGTTVKIKIPLTLAIIPGADRDQRRRTLRHSAGQPAGTGPSGGRRGGNGHRDWCTARPCTGCAGNCCRWFTRTASYGFSEAPARDRETTTAVNIVVLQADGRQFGLVVDEINDTEEIVVKPLGKQLKGITTFAGATIMGDGRVALILDVLGLAQQASVITEVHDRAASGGASSARRRTPRIRPFWFSTAPMRLAWRCRSRRWRGSKSFRLRKWKCPARNPSFNIAGRSFR